MKSGSDRPWKGLEIKIHPNVVALFNIGITTQIGNGTSTLFWLDRWFMGCCLKHLAPEVVAAVPPNIRESRTVEEALSNRSCPRDMQGGLSMVGWYDYFHLWDALYDLVLEDMEDQHQWRLDSSGQFTAKSAYKAFFNGAITFEPWKLIWKSWAPGKCKAFIWLAVCNRCWTADRLQKRGLPHPDKCPLCDQEDETAQHMLVSCVFARDFWFKIFSLMGFAEMTPGPQEDTFALW